MDKRRIDRDRNRRRRRTGSYSTQLGLSGLERERKAEAARRASRRRRKKRVRLIVALILILCIVLLGIVVGGIYWVKYGPTKETYDLKKYFGITTDSQFGITVNNEVLDANAIQVDGEVYVTYDTVQEYITDRFYWDPNESILLYTLPTDMVKAGPESKDYMVSDAVNSEEYIIVKVVDNTPYIALDFIKQYTDLDYNVYESPNRVQIVSEFKDIKTASAKKDTQVRYRGGVKSPVLEEVSKGDKLTIIEDASDWEKVRTKSGIIGYIQKSKLGKILTETTARDFEEPEYTSIHKDYKINLAWHQVTSSVANSSVQDTIASTKGLTTISPTWFSVADNSGNLNSIASTDYVSYAHQAGLEVWALVDNFGENIDQMELLSHTSSRENLESQLIANALQNGIDGINVDFEQIPTDVGEHYIQFIRELSVKCRVNNLVLSVDNYVPKGYNTHYHRKEQGIVADYVIIMGYDEHFGGSYEAGSVASYNYVKEGIEETLKDVPAEKVINAVPFYTRLWNEIPKTEQELAAEQGTEAANYSTKVTSEALGMEEAARRVSEAGVTATWDDTVKQDYAEWTGSDGSTYKIWLENAASLETKLQLIKENNLAGVAEWKLGFETADIWDLIQNYLN